MPSISNLVLMALLEGPPKTDIVESRCVDDISYDELTGDLDVTFIGPPNGGSGTYRYHGVPLGIYVEFSQAFSLGTYFNLYIRDQYSYTRIS